MPRPSRNPQRFEPTELLEGRRLLSIATPGDLQVPDQHLTAFSATFTWIDNATSEEGYVIDVGTDFDQDGIIGPDEFFYPEFVEADATTLTIPWLAPEIVYTVSVRAYAGQVFSSAAEASFTTKPAPPLAPTGLSVVPDSIDETHVFLIWSAAEGATQYRVERLISGGSFVPLTLVGSASASVACPSDSTHHYRVVAINGGGESEPSEPATGQSNLWTPAAISAGGVTTSSVQLLWNDQSSRESAFTIAYQRLDESGYVSDYWPYVMTVPAGTDSCIINDLDGNTPSAPAFYAFKVQAIGVDGTSSFSNIVIGAPSSIAAIAPADFGFAVSAGQLTAHWTPSQNIGSMIVEYRRSPEDDWIRYGYPPEWGMPPYELPNSGFEPLYYLSGSGEARIGARNASMEDGVWAYSEPVEFNSSASSAYDSLLRVWGGAYPTYRYGYGGSFVAVGGNPEPVLSLLTYLLPNDTVIFGIPGGLSIWAGTAAGDPLVSGQAYTGAQLMGPEFEGGPVNITLPVLGTQAGKGLAVQVTQNSSNNGVPYQVRDMVRLSVFSPELIAHRTGERQGEQVSADDPDDYVILVNNDWDDGFLDMDLADREAAAIKPGSGLLDDELAKLELTQLPGWLRTGTLCLKLSSRSIRIFNDSGSFLWDNSVNTPWGDRIFVCDLAKPVGPLAKLMEGNLTLYFEAVSAHDDFSIALEYSPPGGLTTESGVHARLVEWSFLNGEQQHVSSVQAMYGEFLLNAAKGDPLAYLPPPRCQFFNSFQMLPPDQVQELTMQSTSASAETYSDSLVEDWLGLHSQDPVVLYYLSESGALLSQQDRNLILQGVQGTRYQTLHDDQAQAELRTVGGDVFRRAIGSERKSVFNVRTWNADVVAALAALRQSELGRQQIARVEAITGLTGRPVNLQMPTSPTGDSQFIGQRDVLINPYDQVGVIAECFRNPEEPVIAKFATSHSAAFDDISLDIRLDILLFHEMFHVVERLIGVVWQKPAMPEDEWKLRFNENVNEYYAVQDENRYRTVIGAPPRWGHTMTSEQRGLADDLVNCGHTSGLPLIDDPPRFREEQLRRDRERRVNP